MPNLDRADFYERIPHEIPYDVSYDKAIKALKILVILESYGVDIKDAVMGYLDEFEFSHNNYGEIYDRIKDA